MRAGESIEFRALSAPPCVHRLRCLAEREGLKIFLAKLFGFFDLCFARNQDAHLSLRHGFSIGLDQPDSAGEAVDLVGRVHRAARRSYGINSAERPGRRGLQDKPLHRPSLARQDLRKADG